MVMKGGEEKDNGYEKVLEWENGFDGWFDG